MIKKESSNVMRKIRHTRVRNKIAGTSEVPRLNVFRSNNNIFAQIIDDEAMKRAKELVEQMTLREKIDYLLNETCTDCQWAYICHRKK